MFTGKNFKEEASHLVSEERKNQHGELRKAFLTELWKRGTHAGRRETVLAARKANAERRGGTEPDYGEVQSKA